MKKEIGDLGHTGPYRPPARLRKRSEFSSKGADEKVFEANEYVCFTNPDGPIMNINAFVLMSDCIFAGRLWVWCSTKTPSGTSSGKTSKITT